MTTLKFPEAHRNIFLAIGACAQTLGVQAYVVGGYVRDMLLDKPSKDIDVVCIGSGIALAKSVAALSGAAVTVYENFGTAALVHEGVELEFVGARKESYERGSRKPIVEDGTLVDDLTRRDFTFNALALSLNWERFGELTDLFGGVRDLYQGIIRTPTDPNVTFSDDPLRMLRAIRFAARFGFEISPETRGGIAGNVHRMSIVSAERIKGELDKIMTSAKPSAAWRLMSVLGLQTQILPELDDMLVNDEGHKNNYEHTMDVLDNATELSGDLLLRWAALLHDIGKPRTKGYLEGHGWTFYNHEEVGAVLAGRILGRLKFSVDDTLFVQKLVRLHGRPMQMAGNVTDSAVRRIMFDAGEAIGPLMLLVRSDFSTKKPARIQRHKDYCDTTEAKMVQLEAADSMKAFRPALMGDELMERFNLKPSRLVGQIKKAMTDAILDGEVANEHDALVQWVDDYLAGLGGVQ